MPRSRSAWWPGGLTSAKAFCTTPSNTAAVASTRPPAAISAASVGSPGDVGVHVEMSAASGGYVFDLLHVLTGVHTEQQVFIHRARCDGRQRRQQAVTLQALPHTDQALAPLRVAGVVVFQKDWVVYVAGSHVTLLMAIAGAMAMDGIAMDLATVIVDTLV